MSHIGKEAIIIPKNIKIKKEKNLIIIQGEETFLTKKVPSFLEIEEINGYLHINIPENLKKIRYNKSLWGTYRTLINNMIIGVSQGWTMKLLLVGIGFRSKVESNILTLRLGYSHIIEYIIPEGVTITCSKPTLIYITGIDYELVTKVAAEIRSYKRIEPYKGKGIRYINEVINLKETKKK